METFPDNWPFVRGIHRSPVDVRQTLSDAVLWCYLCRSPEQTDEQTVVLPAIWDDTTFMQRRHHNRLITSKLNSQEVIGKIMHAAHIFIMV